MNNSDVLGRLTVDSASTEFYAVNHGLIYPDTGVLFVKFTWF